MNLTQILLSIITLLLALMFIELLAFHKYIKRNIDTIVLLLAKVHGQRQG
jgi:hypothetical protein